VTTTPDDPAAPAPELELSTIGGEVDDLVRGVDDLLAWLDRDRGDRAEGAIGRRLEDVGASIEELREGVARLAIIAARQATVIARLVTELAQSEQ
jgi:hypothetical protein